jgi:glycosyltransferase involved in cell wall biosynthesis
MRNSVGVVIPTFNRPSETLRAIHSVLEQSYEVEQIVVVDDGSALELSQELKKNTINMPVQIIRINASNHPGRARNIGIDNIKTKWTAFLDSDDSWTKDKIETQLQASIEFNTKSICSNARTVGNGVVPESSTNLESGFLSRRRLLKCNEIVNSTVLVDTSLLREIGKIDSRYSMRGAEDYVTWLMIADYSKWYVCADNLADYQIDSPDSIRMATTQTEIDSHIQGLIGYIERKNGSKIQKKIIRKFLTYAALI